MILKKFDVKKCPTTWGGSKKLLAVSDGSAQNAAENVAPDTTLIKGFGIGCFDGSKINYLPSLLGTQPSVIAKVRVRV